MAARYQEYEKELKTAGIHILHNESCSLQVGKTSLTVYGLEIPLIYYKKPFSPQLRREEVRELIGEPSSDLSLIHISAKAQEAVDAAAGILEGQIK